jgi:signal transduction histidine kinase/DNA-binding response OmpR family regulator
MSEGRPVTVLNVDDYQPGLYARSRILRQAGFEVREASTGRDALRIVAEVKPDIVLLDVNLPDVDGGEVCRRIKADPETASIPVIHLSATAIRERDRIRGFELGADNYLVEPLDPDELVANVHALLRMRRAEQTARAAAAEAERRRREAEVLTELARTINASLDLDTVLRQVAGAARDLCRSDAAHVALRDPATGCAIVRQSVGSPCGPAHGGLVIEPGKGLGGEVLASGRPLRTDHYAEDGRFTGEDAQRAHEVGAVAAMAVPVLMAGSVEGLLYVLNTSARPFTAHDEAVLQRLGDHAAIAIRNGRSFAREQAARAEAEAANRAKDQFLATLSHELRTPLTALVGWVRLLKDGRLDEGLRLRALESIDRNARAQAQLVDDLLDVSRIVTGQLRLETRLVDPAAIVTAALDAVRPAAGLKRIDLEATLGASPRPIVADPDRLHQVLANLLDNALKFTPEGGRVHVGLRQAGDRVEVTVRDNGQGIGPDFLPHVFDRFRQADMTATKSHGGLGLGLAIVRHLVELHGGAVQAQSPGEGQGATFTVTLPAGPVDTVSRPVSRSASAPPRLDGVRVLLVEDEADSRDLLTVVLREAGGLVTAVGSTSEALDALVRDIPDVLVSDIAMPGEDGFALIARLRTLPRERGGSVPVVALTAYAGAETRDQTRAAGFEAHVGKPVRPEDLIAAIAGLLSRSPAE